MTSKKYTKFLMVGVICALGITLTGCNLLYHKSEEGKKETQKEENLGMTETKDGIVQYTSKDSVISLTLPNKEWKVEKEFDVLYRFASAYGDIEVRHVIGADAKKVLPAYKEDEMQERIQQERQNALSTSDTQDTAAVGSFSLEDYRCNIIRDTAYYRYRLELTDDPNYACKYVIGIQNTKEIYEIIGGVKEDTAEYRSEIEESMDSFILIKNREFQEALTKSKQYKESTTDGSIAVSGFKTVKYASDYEGIDEEEKDGTIYTCVSSVNVRDSAGMNSSVIGALEIGDEVKVLNQEGGWYEIEYEGTVGYVYQDYLGQ